MQAKKCIRDMPVRYVKGVGPAKAALFEKLGVSTVYDLLYHLPRRYEDRTRVVTPSQVEPGKPQAVRGKVLKRSGFKARTGTGIFEITVGDGKGKVYAVWYNQPFLSKVLSVGQDIVLYGVVEPSGRPQMTHPHFEIEDGSRPEESLEIGRIVPFYPLTEKVSQRELRRAVNSAVKCYASQGKDPIPTRIRARRHLVDLKFAVENIHFPRSFENLSRAHRRFVFEEFFILQVIMARRRKNRKKGGVSHTGGDSVLNDLVNLFPFELTPGQRKCIFEVERDMAAPKPMYRLLQGDVGSGKTVVAMFAVLLSCRNGHQGVVMAPTEILARQHYVSMSKVFMPLGVNVRLLVGSMDPGDREKIRQEASNGEADVIIGTHSLIQQSVEFKDLAIAVIDEQHKFGVEQRKKLIRKGKLPDTLVMTATPIPRSLVLTLFGDMDISVMKDKPMGRQEVLTYWTSGDKREEVYSLIRDEVGNGRQAFIVCPRIKAGPEDSPGPEASLGGVERRAKDPLTLSAENMYSYLKKDIFPEFNIAMLHGRTPVSERESIMKGFVEGRIDILVATTMIEVGVDVPNVSVMLVEHAQMYGLSQLHQLRGRIGRGKHVSYCVLVSGDDSESSRQRMEAITSMEDGFSIAEKDLDIRGPGEFLGTRQSGLPELRFGDLVRDFAVMEDARKDAFEIVAEDPELLDPRNAAVRERVKDFRECDRVVSL